MPEFYMIFARKIFSRIFGKEGGQLPQLSPTPMVCLVTNVYVVLTLNDREQTFKVINTNQSIVSLMPYFVWLYRTRKRRDNF